jgi:hypothetical protein
MGMKLGLFTQLGEEYRLRMFENMVPGSRKDAGNASEELHICALYQVNLLLG